MKTTELIVMLTYNDYTVKNAHKIFDECKNTKVKYWGFKDKGLSFEKMKLLFEYMKRCGKKTVLEIVEYEEKACLVGACLAKNCNCDILMGTTFFNSVNEYCKQNNIKYMPFAGNVCKRPSILNGHIQEIIKDAKANLNNGLYGFDLLGYRYTGNPTELITNFISHIDAPVCVAGSIDNYEKLDFIKSISPWAFTIGSAFFDNKFEGTFKEQIDKVYGYIN
ncbi:hypothetical protein [Mammaliicoccus vitulinus]|uniref:hypothetical protein n=1 Tax=Mammaliicoccus vitulinus TaxID=71237 RepID=UPI003BA0AB7A